MDPRSQPTLFQILRLRGRDIYKKSCKYSKLHENLAKTREQLIFNLRCKRNNVLPKSLRFRPPIRTPSGWATAKRMGR